MNPLKFIGKGITYLGIGALILMSIVGSLAIDIVILAALNKALFQNRRGYNSFGDSFVTGFLFGMFFSSNNYSANRGFYSNAGAMMLASPVLTAIAIGLAFLLGVPEVAFVLIAGWVGAFGIVGAGIVIHFIGEKLGDLFTAIANHRQKSSPISPQQPNDAASDTPPVNYGLKYSTPATPATTSSFSTQSLFSNTTPTDTATHQAATTEPTAPSYQETAEPPPSYYASVFTSPSTYPRIT